METTTTEATAAADDLTNNNQISTARQHYETKITGDITICNESTTQTTQMIPSAGSVLGIDFEASEKSSEEDLHSSGDDESVTISSSPASPPQHPSKLSYNSNHNNNDTIDPSAPPDDFPCPRQTTTITLATRVSLKSNRRMNFSTR